MENKGSKMRHFFIYVIDIHLKLSYYTYKDLSILVMILE